MSEGSVPSEQCRSTDPVPAGPVPEPKWHQQMRQSQSSPGSETPEISWFSSYFQSGLELLKTDFKSDNKWRELRVSCTSPKGKPDI